MESRPVSLSFLDTRRIYLENPVANVRRGSSQRARKAAAASHEVTRALACSRVSSFLDDVRDLRQKTVSQLLLMLTKYYERWTNFSSSLFHVMPKCPIRRADLAATLVLLHTAFAKLLHNFAQLENEQLEN